jgi:hypothetical protein
MCCVPSGTRIILSMSTWLRLGLQEALAFELWPTAHTTSEGKHGSSKSQVTRRMSLTKTPIFSLTEVVRKGTISLENPT